MVFFEFINSSIMLTSLMALPFFSASALVAVLHLRPRRVCTCIAGSVLEVERTIPNHSQTAIKTPNILADFLNISLIDFPPVAIIKSSN